MSLHPKWNAPNAQTHVTTVTSDSDVSPSSSSSIATARSSVTTERKRAIDGPNGSEVKGQKRRATATSDVLRADFRTLRSGEISGQTFSEVSDSFRTLTSALRGMAEEESNHYFEGEQMDDGVVNGDLEENSSPAAISKQQNEMKYCHARPPIETKCDSKLLHERKDKDECDHEGATDAGRSGGPEAAVYPPPTEEGGVVGESESSPACNHSPTAQLSANWAGAFGRRERSQWTAVIGSLEGNDPASQAINLQRVCEFLSFACMYGLRGFPVHRMTNALIRLLDRLNPADGDDDVSMDLGLDGPGSAVNRAMLACSCIHLILDLSPPVAALIVEGDGIRVLSDKLKCVQYIDLDESICLIFEKLSEEHPNSLVKASVVTAMLKIIDFFPTFLQVKATKIAGNVFASVSSLSDFDSEVLPNFEILSNLLRGVESVLLENVTRCLKLAAAIPLKILSPDNEPFPTLSDEASVKDRLEDTEATDMPKPEIPKETDAKPVKVPQGADSDAFQSCFEALQKSDIVLRSLNSVHMLEKLQNEQIGFRLTALSNHSALSALVNLCRRELESADGATPSIRILTDSFFTLSLLARFSDRVTEKLLDLGVLELFEMVLAKQGTEDGTPRLDEIDSLVAYNMASLALSLLPSLEYNLTSVRDDELSHIARESLGQAEGPASVVAPLRPQRTRTELFRNRISDFFQFAKVLVAPMARLTEYAVQPQLSALAHQVVVSFCMSGVASLNLMEAHGIDISEPRSVLRGVFKPDFSANFILLSLNRLNYSSTALSCLSCLTALSEMNDVEDFRSLARFGVCKALGAFVPSGRCRERSVFSQRLLDSANDEDNEKTDASHGSCLLNLTELIARTAELLISKIESARSSDPTVRPMAAISISENRAADSLLELRTAFAPGAESTHSELNQRFVVESLCDYLFPFDEPPKATSVATARVEVANAIVSAEGGMEPSTATRLDLEEERRAEFLQRFQQFCSSFISLDVNAATGAVDWSAVDPCPLIKLGQLCVDGISRSTAFLPFFLAETDDHPGQSASSSPTSTLHIPSFLLPRRSPLTVARCRRRRGREPCDKLSGGANPLALFSNMRKQIRLSMKPRRALVTFPRVICPGAPIQYSPPENSKTRVSSSAVVSQTNKCAQLLRDVLGSSALSVNMRSLNSTTPDDASSDRASHATATPFDESTASGSLAGNSKVLKRLAQLRESIELQRKHSRIFKASRSLRLEQKVDLNPIRTVAGIQSLRERLAHVLRRGLSVTVDIRASVGDWESEGRIQHEKELCHLIDKIEELLTELDASPVTESNELTEDPNQHLSEVHLAPSAPEGSASAEMPSVGTSSSFASASVANSDFLLMYVGGVPIPSSMSLSEALCRFGSCAFIDKFSCSLLQGRPYKAARRSVSKIRRRAHHFHASRRELDKQRDALTEARANAVASDPSHTGEVAPLPSPYSITSRAAGTAVLADTAAAISDSSTVISKPVTELSASNDSSVTASFDSILQTLRTLCETRKSGGDPPADATASTDNENMPGDDEDRHGNESEDEAVESGTRVEDEDDEEEEEDDDDYDEDVEEDDSQMEGSFDHAIAEGRSHCSTSNEDEGASECDTLGSELSSCDSHVDCAESDTSVGGDASPLSPEHMDTVEAEAQYLDCKYLGSYVLCSNALLPTSDESGAQTPSTPTDRPLNKPSAYDSIRPVWSVTQEVQHEDVSCTSVLAKRVDSQVDKPQRLTALQVMRVLRTGTLTERSAVLKALAHESPIICTAADPTFNSAVLFLEMLDLVDGARSHITDAFDLKELPKSPAKAQEPFNKVKGGNVFAAVLDKYQFLRGASNAFLRGHTLARAAFGERITQQYTSMPTHGDVADLLQSAAADAANTESAESTTEVQFSSEGTEPTTVACSTLKELASAAQYSIARHFPQRLRHTPKHDWESTMACAVSGWVDENTPQASVFAESPAVAKYVKLLIFVKEVLSFIHNLALSDQTCLGSSSPMGISAGSAARATHPSVLQRDLHSATLSQHVLRQLNDPIAIASHRLPLWMTRLISAVPFIIDFETRLRLYNATSLGGIRALRHYRDGLKDCAELTGQLNLVGGGARNSPQHISRQTGCQTTALMMPLMTRISASGDRYLMSHMNAVLSLPRTKVKLPRSHMILSAIKVMDHFQLVTSKNAQLVPALEIEYLDEEGVGSGPTLEFFSEVVSKLDTDCLPVLFRDERPDGFLFPQPHVVDPSTLSLEFLISPQNVSYGVVSPAATATGAEAQRGGPLADEDEGIEPPPSPVNIAGDSDASTTRVPAFGVYKTNRGVHAAALFTPFKLLGQLAAKAVADGRLVNLRFHPFFWRLVQQYRRESVIDADVDIAAVDPGVARAFSVMRGMLANGEDVSSLGLNFTLLGSEPTIELIPGGSSINVTNDNVLDYIREATSWILWKGVRLQVWSFSFGFATLSPLWGVQLFDEHELANKLLCGGVASHDEFWSLDHVSVYVQPDYGYTRSSPMFVAFLALLTAFSVNQRTAFLKFCTGTSVLPSNGFAGLRPGMKVVKKEADKEQNVDCLLPSVMTCSNYIKLPDYSTLEVLERQLLYAISEGQGAFTLS